IGEGIGRGVEDARAGARECALEQVAVGRDETDTGLGVLRQYLCCPTRSGHRFFFRLRAAQEPFTRPLCRKCEGFDRNTTLLQRGEERAIERRWLIEAPGEKSRWQESMRFCCTFGDEVHQRLHQTGEGQVVVVAAMCFESAEPLKGACAIVEVV